jgi:hypothetical protein
LSCVMIVSSAPLLLPSFSFCRPRDFGVKLLFSSFAFQDDLKIVGYRHYNTKVSTSSMIFF